MPIRIVEDRMYAKLDWNGDVRVTRKVCVDSEGRMHSHEAVGWRIWRPPEPGWTLMHSEPRQPGDEELRG